MKELFLKIGKKLEEKDAKCEYSDSDGNQTLKVVLNNSGKRVVMELSPVIAESDEECFYFEFYTIIAKDIDNNKTADLLKSLNMINIIITLGYFGYLPDGGILYHKYVLRTLQKADLFNELYGTALDIMSALNNEFIIIVNALNSK